MKIRRLVAGLALLPAAAQAQSTAQHDHHVGHVEAPSAPEPHAGHTMPSSTDPHAGHRMPAAADPHADHKMAMPAKAPSTPPPPAPSDKAAERFYTAEQMLASREQLAVEHGDGRYWTVRLETADWRPEGDGFAWEGEAWYGGDVHRVTLKTQGEGASGDVEKAEAQILYSRAVGPYFNLQAGVRQDLGDRPRRTYGAIGFEGVAPYWFEVEGTAFLSDKGDVSARLEAAYDLRITQRLILEPRVEVELSAQDVPAQNLGAGFSGIETGLRLRYEFNPEFAPYIGVHHERALGRTADMVRAAGEKSAATVAVVGVRAWF